MRNICVAGLDDLFRPDWASLVLKVSDILSRRISDVLAPSTEGPLSHIERPIAGGVSRAFWIDDATRGHELFPTIAGQ
jgi:hypothetical protein